MTVIGRIKLSLVAVTFAIISACTASTGPTPQPQSAITAPTPLGQNTSAQTTPSPDASIAGYKLGNGDTLRITVFGEEDLSGEFQVDGTGVISLPLIGEVEAVGKSVREVQRTIEARLLDGYLNNPRVSAEVINFRPFYILGEVNSAGQYPYTDGLTIHNAVATAGGFTYRANKRVVFVRGAGEAQEREVELTATSMVSPGDTIRIGERLF